MNAATPLSDWTPSHFKLAVSGGVASITLSRPEKKNALTFESYAELVALFRAAATDTAMSSSWTPRRTFRP